MKPKIIHTYRLKEKDYGSTKVTDIFNTKNYPNFSIAKIRKVGNDIKIGLDKESDVAYYVLEGKGICVIENKEHTIQKGDLVFIPHGTKYKNLKGSTLLAIASPRFSRKKRIRFKSS